MPRDIKASIFLKERAETSKKRPRDKTWRLLFREKSNKKLKIYY
jgi:hypothetical protein